MTSTDLEDDEVASFVHRLRRLDCCAVSDALDRLKLPGVISGIPQQSGNGRIAGRAITVKLGIGESPPGPARHLGTTAVEAAGPLDIIVVEQRSGIEAGSWGGLLTLGAKLRGAAGVIADGPVRDIDEARIYEFPVYSPSTTARTARGRIVELGNNVPVVIGGVRVDVGDYIIADSSAIIAIKPANAAEVITTAEAIAAKEAAMANALLSGVPISQVMSGNYEHMLAG
jgi:4-hydroxy-4-methyl-2-oxoglutarate aldolase